MNRVLRSQLNPKVKFNQFLMGSPFAKSYFQARNGTDGFAICLSGDCPINFRIEKNKDQAYETHLILKHSEIYDQIMKKYQDRFPPQPNPPLEDNSDLDTPMVDVVTEHDQDDRIVNVKELVTKLHKKSRFFQNVNDLDKFNREFVAEGLADALHSRLSTLITFEGYKTMSTFLTTNLTKRLGQPYSDEAKRYVETFRISKPLQETYLERTNLLIEPRTIRLKGKQIGQYVDLKQLVSKTILKNVSLVQSIVDEKKNFIQHKFEKYNSELCCSPERQKLILGKLRIELGIDDFSVTLHNRKFLAVYGVFTNIPIQERLKRRNIFLIAIADRDVMKKSNVTVNDFLKEIVDDLEHLTKIGLPISVEYASGRKETLTIKAALTALVGDNLGQYELLGLRTTFFKGFICRYCACTHADIQKTSTHRRKRLLVGSEQEIEEYKAALEEVKELERKKEEYLLQNPCATEQTLKRKFSPKNRLGVNKECVFTRLLGLTIWNIAPPDVLHDLSEGVIPRLLDIILRHAIDVSKFPVNNSRRKTTFRWKHEQIKKRLESFPLYNGNIRISLKTKRPFFNFHGKAVEKTEIFARLLEIFTEEFICDNDNAGFRLYLTLHEFCSIAFNFEVSEDDLAKLDKCAKDLIDLVYELEGDEEKQEESVEAEEEEEEDVEAEDNASSDEEPNVGDDEEVEEYEDKEEDYDDHYDDEDEIADSTNKNKNLIFSKLHSLLHYSELTRRYGPLVLFSTLKYERKHQFFKNLATIMKNFKNPTLTFASHHQRALVMILQNENFIQTDFFCDTSMEVDTVSSGSLKAELNIDHGELNPLLRPHRVNKNILRKINLKESPTRREFWICSETFVKAEDGSIYAKGTIYELKKRNKGNYPEVLDRIYENLMVDMKYIFFRNDFLFVKKISTETGRGRKKVKDESSVCYLIRGVM